MAAYSHRLKACGVSRNTLPQLLHWKRSEGAWHRRCPKLSSGKKSKRGFGSQFTRAISARRGKSEQRVGSRQSGNCFEFGQTRRTRGQLASKEQLWHPRSSLLGQLERPSVLSWEHFRAFPLLSWGQWPSKPPSSGPVFRLLQSTRCGWAMSYRRG